MKKLIFCLLLCSISLCGCGNSKSEAKNDIEYTISTQEDVSIPDETRETFRVVIQEDATEEDLLTVFDEIDKDDIDNVTVWFYSSEEAIENGPYDVGMIERTGDEEPELTFGGLLK